MTSLLVVHFKNVGIEKKNILIHPYLLVSFFLSLSSFWLCLLLYVTEHASMILHLRYVLMYFLLRKFPTVADYAWTFRTNKHTNNALLRSSVLLAFEKKNIVKKESTRCSGIYNTAGRLYTPFFISFLKEIDTLSRQECITLIKIDSK